MNHPVSMPCPQYRLPAAIILAAAILGVHLFLGFGFIRSAAPTYDEPSHLAIGYSYLRTPNYRLTLVMDHPPLAEMWAAVPLLRLGPNLFLQHPDWIAGRHYPYADYFLYHNRISAETMMSAARRFSFVTWTVLLAFALLAWACRLAGPGGIVGAAAVYALCPALLSNLALVTADGASTTLFFWTCWLLNAAQNAPNFRRSVLLWVAAGVCCGLGNAAKFNMIVLVPIGLGVAFLNWYRSPEPRPRIPALQAGCFLAAGFIVLAAVYRFRQFPVYVEGLLSTLRGLDLGRSSFFMGRHSTTGSAFYFPVALAVKIPLAAWLLAALGLWHMPPRERPWAILPPLLYFAAALTAKVQIGYRHVLPVVPFLVLWAGGGAAWLGKQGLRRTERTAIFRAGAISVLAALLAWNGWSVARVHPHYLAYFNEIAGGPENGWKWLVDSNLDWGQGLQTLSTELKNLGDPPIYLSYFGSADPAAYGIRYAPVATMSDVERRGNLEDPSAAGRVFLAVSATNLQCVYFEDKTLFDWLRSYRPLRVAGYSIFLYDLTGNAPAYRRLARLLALSGQPGAARALLSRLGSGT